MITWLDLHPWVPVLIVGVVPWMFNRISRKIEANAKARAIIQKSMHEENLREFQKVKDRLDITNGKVVAHTEQLNTLRRDSDRIEGEVKGLVDRERDRWGAI